MVLAVFGPLDWAIVGLYFLLVTVVGVWIGRRTEAQKRAAIEASKGGEVDAETSDYFLGGRSMPTWTVAVSIVATMLSAATFVGVPDAAYKGDLTYLAHSIGGVIAVFFVALVFVPRLYRAGTVTIYGFLAQRYGETARLAVSCAFIFGRLLASGARLFLAAIPLSLLMYGAQDPKPSQMITAILMIGAVGTFYTVKGGVRAVVWVDAIQLLIVIGTAAVAIGMLLHRIPLGVGEIIHLLRETPVGTGGGSKLQLIDLSTDMTKPYTIWASVFAAMFLAVAAYGTDQDLAQRFLITKSARKGGMSVIASQFLGAMVIFLFLVIGLLLYVFYDRPDVMGAVNVKPADAKSMYPWFLLNEMPTVLAGFSIAGFFAIAQGSMDSAMNALASSIVADVYVPWQKRRGVDMSKSGGQASRWTVALVGLTMCLFAIVCALVYDPKNRTLLDFALGLMTFAMSGMLGVFLTALLTKRGSSASVVAALLAGALTVSLLQDGVMGWWSKMFFGQAWRLAWPWWMTIGSIVAFFVCQSGSTKSRDPADISPVGNPV